MFNNLNRNVTAKVNFSRMMSYACLLEHLEKKIGCLSAILPAEPTQRSIFDI